ncbi:hypothetical protein [Ascidiaceihabitans sp.]|uniref:hypothetical protein n=1 Tax=Ascidiaceihabitans sp. TaxID=1872644 RepID=UPI003298D8C9
MMQRDGFVVFDHDAGVQRWAQTAYGHVPDVHSDRSVPQDQLRHGRTWFVGLDALPNDDAGTVDGVPLTGPWQAHVPDMALHRAQLSVVYPGYPLQDAGESPGNHRFRITRKAAHVDGLLPVGVHKRRFAQELHAYILGIPLHDCAAAPTVVWRGSHVIMQRALKDAIGGRNPGQVDVTEAYQNARRHVFETCEMVPLTMTVGQAALIHRFALHGTEVWASDASTVNETHRAIAFFRPAYSDGRDWLGGSFS